MKTGIWAPGEHITLDAGMHLSLSGLGKVSYTYPLITLESLLDQLQQKAQMKLHAPIVTPEMV
jgi:hypothetical protein